MKQKILKRVIAVCLMMSVMLVMAACGTNKDNGQEAEGTPEKADMKFGLILPTEGLGDKNFCDMGYEGLLMAQEEFGIEFDYAEPKSISDYESCFRMYAESEEYELILGLGSGQSDALSVVAEEFPEQKFGIVDSQVDMPNVSCYSTKWPEQTFLCGVLAGLGTLDERLEKSNSENVIGVVLGADYPSLRSGVVGFEAGARYVNPDCEVLEAVVGDFNDPAKGKEVALSMYDRGADFIQHIAGATGLGVFSAAKEADGYAIGVGKSQSYIDPDYIIATSVGNVHLMVYNEIKTTLEGTWEPGVHNWGIKEDAVGFSNEDSNVEIPEDILDVIEAVKKEVAQGTLIPPSTEEELAEWLEENQYKG